MIDLEKLKNSTLLELRKLVTECLNEPNEVGPTNMKKMYSRCRICKNPSNSLDDLILLINKILL